MRRRRLLRVVAVLFALWLVVLAVNAVLAERASKAARADVGRILDLDGGDLQVREDGDRGSPPLVLIHGWTGSIRWWDRVTPALAERHRVVRVDLLGHGGSEMPRGGYAIEKQADLVAAAMQELGVRRATVVAHSLGGAVATSLAERHGERVAKLMIIGSSPGGVGHLSVLERIPLWPVVGQATRSFTPDPMIRARLEETFIEGTDVPDAFVDGLDRMTWNAFHDTAAAGAGFREDRSLPERLAAARAPLHVIFGKEDNVADPDDAKQYRAVPGAEVQLLDGLGHTPHVERPDLMARLILRFADDARTSR